MPDMTSESQESPPSPPAGEDDAPRSEARRRAIAYLDLWERQLAQVASDGVTPSRLPADRGIG